MNILVTGGAGYIGSHAVKRLLRDGHRIDVLDNLHRGHAEAIDRLRTLPGVDEQRLRFTRGDLRDDALLRGLIVERRIDSVMHFAALAYVGESVGDPLGYYRCNTAGALSLIEACDAPGSRVSRFIFSSTCATYGEPAPELIPIAETCPQSPINPYGASKLFVERVLADYANLRRAQKRAWAHACLRYFNVAGSDPTGLIGEHHEPETHLIPVVLQAALGQRDKVTIFGTDYATPDGTCVRDYIHVEDLVDAHAVVMSALKPGDAGEPVSGRTYNLGIGKGISVRQIIDAAKRVTARAITVTEGPRRPGDPPTLFCDPAKIRRELGWSAKVTNLDEIIASAWKWMQANPRGYAS